MSTLLDRIKLAVRAGLQFGGSRDLYTVFGYNPKPNFNDFVAKYSRQDIASRIIDAPVAATWRGSPIVTDEDGPDSEFSKAWEKIVIEKELYHYFERVDRLAGLGSYSALLFGVDDGQTLNLPLAKAENINYMQPYGQGSITVQEYEEDTTNPRFSLPTMYKLSLQTPSKEAKGIEQSATRKTQQVLVHHSRILHVAETRLEDETFGVSRMLKVYNLLDDMLKVVGGSAETFWLTANRGMQADVDKDMIMQDGDAQALNDELEEYQHQLRRWIRTKGVKISNLGSDVADPSSVFEVQIALLAGASTTPVRILLGSERGELSSEQDRANWANRIEERRSGYAEIVIIKPTVKQLAAAGVVPEPKGYLNIEWKDAFAPSPLERAQTMAQTARAATNLGKTLDYDLSPITQSEARVILDLDPEVPDEIKPVPEETEETTSNSNGTSPTNDQNNQNGQNVVVNSQNDIRAVEITKAKSSLKV